MGFLSGVEGVFSQARVGCILVADPEHVASEWFEGALVEAEQVCEADTVLVWLSCFIGAIWIRSRRWYHVCSVNEPLVKMSAACSLVFTKRILI